MIKFSQKLKYSSNEYWNLFSMFKLTHMEVHVILGQFLFNANNGSDQVRKQTKWAQILKGCSGGDKFQ